MAAPQRRRYQASVPTRPMTRPVEEEGRPRGRPGERDARGAKARRKAAERRRRFVALVVVPVLLMLGSVYVHTVSAGLTAQAAGLEERLTRVESEGERLDVRVAELSGAERIRSLASEKLGMREPAAADLQVYGNDREDGNSDAGEPKGGEPR